jgi:hypothetical protein
MECESISCKTLTQYAENPLGIEEVLERHHGIVSEADKGTSPMETWLRLELKPDGSSSSESWRNGSAGRCAAHFSGGSIS